VIVGAGPAGLATARSYREHGGDGNVTLLGCEPRLPYRRPPLTKELLRGELDTTELPLERESWYAQHEISPLLGRRATAIDPGAGLVHLEGAEPLAADAIVLATGSRPVRPHLPGMDDPRVLSVRTLEDSLELRGRVESGARVLVLGSGFIGCEIAGSLALRGAAVTLAGEEELPQAKRLGHEVGERLAGWLEDYGVAFRGGATVAGVEDARVVLLEDGAGLEEDCVVLALGAAPRGELAAAAGLPMHEAAVVVDAAMRAAGTGVPVLAVGDVAHAMNAAAGRHLTVEHWGDALIHGEVAGAALAGAERRWEEVPGFWSTIGTRTLKHRAWGDGFDECLVEAGADGAFTAWYSLAGTLVGVLTHERDEDYDRGGELIAAGAAVA